MYIVSLFSLLVVQRLNFFGGAQLSGDQLVIVELEEESHRQVRTPDARGGGGGRLIRLVQLVQLTDGRGLTDGSEARVLTTRGHMCLVHMSG